MNSSKYKNINKKNENIKNIILYKIKLLYPSNTYMMNKILNLALYILFCLSCKLV